MLALPTPLSCLLIPPSVEGEEEVDLLAGEVGVAGSPQQGLRRLELGVGVVARQQADLLDLPILGVLEDPALQQEGVLAVLLLVVLRREHHTDAKN